MRRGGDGGDADDRGVCFVAWLSAHFHGIKLSGLRKLSWVSRKQRQKTNLCWSLPSPSLLEAEFLPGQRYLSFQDVSLRNTDIKGKGSSTAWQNTSHKKRSEVLFCWANSFAECIPVGLLKIKMVIYSCHHLLKRPELKVEKAMSQIQLQQHLKAGWVFNWDLSLKFWYQIQIRILGRNRKWPSSKYSFSLLKSIYFMVLTACQSHLESSRI